MIKLYDFASATLHDRHDIVVTIMDFASVTLHDKNIIMMD